MIGLRRFSRGELEFFGSVASLGPWSLDPKDPSRRPRAGWAAGLGAHGGGEQPRYGPIPLGEGRAGRSGMFFVGIQSRRFTPTISTVTCPTNSPIWYCLSLRCKLLFLLARIFQSETLSPILNGKASRTPSGSMPPCLIRKRSGARLPYPSGKARSMAAWTAVFAPCARKLP